MTDELKARIEKTMQNLRRNRMEAYFCENSAEARELVKTLIKKGDVISNGGSVTLKQTGIYDIISSADYNYLDRSREGITREEVEEVYRKTFSADAFFTSSNAVTENGELSPKTANSTTSTATPTALLRFFTAPKALSSSVASTSWLRTSTRLLRESRQRRLRPTPSASESTPTAQRQVSAFR